MGSVAWRLVPIDVRRPALASQALGRLPREPTTRTDSAGLERVPDVAARALPTVVAFWLPSTLRAANAPESICHIPRFALGACGPTKVVGFSSSLEHRQHATLTLSRGLSVSGVRCRLSACVMAGARIAAPRLASPPTRHRCSP